MIDSHPFLIQFQRQQLGCDIGIIGESDATFSKNNPERLGIGLVGPSVTLALTEVSFLTVLYPAKSVRTDTFQPDPARTDQPVPHQPARLRRRT